MATAAAAIRPSRPSIFVAGVEETGLAQGLIRLRIRESAQGLYHFEAAFGNWGPKSGAIDFLYFDRKKLDFGKAIEIRIDRDVLFTGRISALEAEFAEGRPPQFTVLAEDRLQDLRMTRRTRTFDNVSDADVFRTIAGNHSLQTEIDITGPTHKVLVQVNESDLAFLRGRARLAGVELWVEGTKLLAKTRAARGSRTLTLNYGGDLRTFTVLADLAHQRTKCTVSGWDVAGKAALKSDVTDSILGREIENQDSGASILRTALGERKENVSHLVSTTSAETDAQAESVFRAFARRFVTGRGTAQPNGLIRTGAVLDLKNLGPLFSGKYNVTSVEHTFDSTNGFLTGFEVERAGLGEGAMSGMLMDSTMEGLLFSRTASGFGGRWYGVHVALVTDIQDPDAQGRVKISLPWSPDTGTGKYEVWARIAVLMAGAGRGTWFVPEVDDEVLVAFEGGDPARPYILGGLWNGSDAPPDSLDGSTNNRKVIKSKNGVKVTLDDSSGQEKFIAETPGGQKVTLKDGPGSIEIVDSNGNSIKLEASGITITSSAKVTINASLLEVSASMVTVNAAMSKFSGVVKADTVISNSVISTSYTPGAGNIW